MQQAALLKVVFYADHGAPWRLAGSPARQRAGGKVSASPAYSRQQTKPTAAVDRKFLLNPLENQSCVKMSRRQECAE